MGKIFFLGDSRVAGVGDLHGGWAGLIASTLITQSLQRVLDIFPYNLGVRGNNTADVLERSKREIEARLNPEDRQEPIQIVLSFGVNDTIYLNQEQRTVTSITEFCRSSQRLLEDALQLTPHVLVVGLLPIDEAILDPIPWATEASYKNKIIEEYDTSLEKICKSQNVAFCPLFSRISKLPHYQDLFIDGLHFTKSGNYLLNEIISAQLFNKNFQEIFRAS